MTLVCPDCFDQKGLGIRIAKIRPDYDEGKCDFHPTKKGVPLEAVVEIIDDVIRNNYHISMGVDQNGDMTGGSLHEFLYELTGADNDDLIGEIASTLIENDSNWAYDGGEPFYDEEYGYRLATEFLGEQHSNRWRHFCDRIVNEQRFFNAQAQDTLKHIFDGLHFLRGADSSKVMYELDSRSSVIYRARIANDPDLQKRIANDVAKELGPPPKRLRSPGRMNPSGIRTFYGAFNVQTCVSELRPAVGEVLVAAAFSLRRPILVLDTTKFSRAPKPQDIFTKTYNKRRSLWAFMAQFMWEIAQPCLPSDEHLDYIPTQVVAEYLVHLHKFKYMGKERTIDGIIYKSAQYAQGVNIAIFGEAAEVFEPPSDDGGFSRYKRSNPALEAVPNSVSVKRVGFVKHGIENYYAAYMDENSPF